MLSVTHKMGRWRQISCPQRPNSQKVQEMQEFLVMLKAIRRLRDIRGVQRTNVANDLGN